MSNDTLLRLAELPNIAGVKDCCADEQQSFDLIRAKPPAFSVMTGEDALFYAALTQGAEGGILASAHVDTARSASVRNIFISGDQPAALAPGARSPTCRGSCSRSRAPRRSSTGCGALGLIDSPEVRLPMTQVSDVLAAQIDREMERSRMAA